jgi:predicted DCC family thiol-disulfide oxidoreductase YuxK|tara:strand:- start:313 stop:663 length:351 start_codon:yes stop_codon:yes gene_type:complete
MKVYFNNSCKICKAEIDLYKKEKIDEINWIDITNNHNALIETKKSNKELLRRLHVEKDGKIFSGAEAFLLVWKNIPKYRLLYSILKLPIIFQIFSIVYEAIAFALFIKNKKQIKTN